MSTKRIFYYEVARFFIYGYSELMMNVDVQFHSDLPKGPKIFVANHPSASDGFLLHRVHRMSILITASAFAFPVFGAFVRGCGQIPVAPGSNASERAVELLRAGKSVGIFPEGTYSPQTGGFGIARHGASRVALKTGAPVIPVGISLRREFCIWLKSKIIGRETAGLWYPFGPYVVTVGNPMAFQGDPRDDHLVASTTSLIMDQITSLADESRCRMRARWMPSKPAHIGQPGSD